MNYKGYSISRAVSLLVRHILGDRDGEEEAACRRMLEETGLDREDWSLQSCLYHPQGKNNLFDPEEAYRRFLKETGRPVRRPSWLKVAASLLLPLSFASAAWFLSRQDRISPEVAATIEPISSQAFIELADGRNIDLSVLQDGLSEQDGTVLCQDSGKLVYCPSGNGDSVIYNVLNVPRAGEFMLVLSDGTEVWVNAGSRLRFPVQFAGRTREVFLEGEAYFDVARDSRHPFVVRVADARVEVTGTGFNVRNYAEEGRVVTTLAEGRVEYVEDSGRKCRLDPGFQVVDVLAEEGLKVRKVNLVEYIGWKDGLYVFYDVTLEEIMKTLERNYDIRVSYASEAMKGLRFTGDLKKYNRVEDFLEFIETGGDVRFVTEGRLVTVLPK